MSSPSKCKTEEYIPTTYSTWNTLIANKNVKEVLTLSSGRFQGLKHIGCGIIMLIFSAIIFIPTAVYQTIKREHKSTYWKVLDVTLITISVPIVAVAYIIKGLAGIVHPAIVYKNKLSHVYQPRAYEKNICGMLKMFVAPAISAR